MKAAERTLARIAARLTPDQTAAVACLREQHASLSSPPDDRQGTVVLGVYLALQGLARRSPELAAVAVAEGTEWLFLLARDA